MQRTTFGALSTLMLLTLVVPHTEARTPINGAPLWSERSNVAPLPPDTPVSISTFSNLASKLSPAVVNITTKRMGRGGPGHPLFDMFRGHGRPGTERQGTGLGTGFVIHADGFALTNHHVIDGATEIEVKLQSGNSYKATVVGSWQPLDVALLKFEPGERLTVAALGNSDDVEWRFAPEGTSHIRKRGRECHIRKGVPH